MNQKVELPFLKSHALFGGIADKDCVFIRDMFQEEHFKAGDIIIKEGESGDSLYFIYEGSVGVFL